MDKSCFTNNKLFFCVSSHWNHLSNAIHRSWFIRWTGMEIRSDEGEHENLISPTNESAPARAIATETATGWMKNETKYKSKKNPIQSHLIFFEFFRYFIVFLKRNICCRIVRSPFIIISYRLLSSGSTPLPSFLSLSIQWWRAGKRVFNKLWQQKFASFIEHRSDSMKMELNETDNRSNFSISSFIVDGRLWAMWREKWKKLKWTKEKYVSWIFIRDILFEMNAQSSMLNG